MTTNSELKPLPCPFCGSEPEVTSWGADTRTGAPFHQIECCECGCSIGHGSEPLATHIERWNSRRTAAQGDQSKEPFVLMSEQVEQAAEQAGFKRIQSCCDVPGKFCSGDVWKGELRAFSLRLLRIVGFQQAGSAEQVSERPQFVAKPLEDYSPEDQAFYRFWYGHMKNEQMTGALANVDHSTARYIWDAALTTQVEQATERMAFETWIKSVGGSVDLVGDGEYRSAPTECAWTAWLARAALSAPERKVTDAELPPLPKAPPGKTIDANGKRLDYSADDMREYALAALNQQGEQTAPEGWQPIETAPKDGTPILLGRADSEFNTAESTVGWWQDAVEDGVDYMGGDAGFVDFAFQVFNPGRSFGSPSHMYAADQPTHWRPLPEAPSTAQKDGGRE